MNSATESAPAAASEPSAGSEPSATLKPSAISQPAATSKPVATLEIMQQLVAVTPFNRQTNSEVTACEDGYAEIIIPFDESLTQHHGFLHGALVGYLADSAMSWAAASVAGDVLTSEYRIHLLAPGKGDSFIGKGYVIKQSRRQVVTRADVYAVTNGEEKLIATSTGTILPTSTA